MTGCGVSWRDHLDIDHALAHVVFWIHVYVGSKLNFKLPYLKIKPGLHFRIPSTKGHMSASAMSLVLIAKLLITGSKMILIGGLGTVFQYNHG